ncbi:MAG: phosphate uptake regulator PhoU [Candidatus Aenigmarchaeota archaeon]|nr:phosphate uptake regulator PhoU [Candidatus Aenigmarchaeota archaeon]
MKRRVVKHGSATLTISLPIKWVKKYGIKPGDELEIDEEKGNLIITTSRDVSQVRSSVLDIDKLGIIGIRALCAIYRSGCDVIRVNFTDPHIISRIEEFIPQLPGFEIMHQDESSCTLKEVSIPTRTDDIDDIIKRTFLVLISVAKDVEENVPKPNNTEALRTLCKRDATINKFCNFCRRILNKKGISRIKDAPMIYYMLESLENLGDEYKYFCKQLIEDKANIDCSNTKIMPLIKDTNKLLENFFYVYFKFNKDNARKFEENARENLVKITAFHRSKNPQEIIYLDYFARITGQLIQMMGPLLAMRLPEECMANE